MTLIENLKEQYEQYQNDNSVSRFHNKSITDIYALLKRTIEYELEPIKYGGLKDSILDSMEKAFK